MKNFISYGDLVDFTASADVASGDFVLLSAGLYGFATNAIANGAKGVLKCKGIFDVSKTSAQAWSVGDTVYWDNTNKVFTTTSSGNTKVGVAVLAAVNPSSTGRIRLNEAV